MKRTLNITLYATLSLLLSATRLLAFDSAVVFNEVHYHPVNEASQTEWIEIKSNQGVDIDISGWSITDGVNFTFPANTVLTGNGLLVIAATPSQIPGAMGPMTGTLKNGDETIRIRNRNGRIMDELDYSDSGDWPLAADGLGFTLSRKNSAVAATGPAAWGTSQQPGGTPGATNFSSAISNSLVFSEIAGASDPAFFIELKNSSANAVSTSGWRLATSLWQSIDLPVVTVASKGYVTFSAADLGLTPSDGLRVVLTSANGTVFRDARSVTNSLRGLTPAGLWGHPSAPSPGSANTFTISNAIVINEVFYQGLGTSPEQWVELYNRSANPVDLSGWKFSEGISYTFLPGTILPDGGYLVIAWDTAAFATLHPGKTALGPFSGSLSGKGETLSLSDANENIANSVRYGDGGLWSQWADGGGSSLELRDPDADNTNPAAWDASDESTKTAWQTITYSGLATNDPSITLAFWNELIVGLLDAGECLIDDVSVATGGTQLIQNGSFASNSNFWRIVGNHTGSIVPDPFLPGNNVLKISAASATDSLYNQANTTLKNGGTFHTIAAASTYDISFRAKWLRGSNRLHSRLYCNRLSRQTLLNVPVTGGTPGAANSRLAANIGPTLSGFGHTPVVPAASAAATVTVSASDPDGVASVLLFRSINGATFTSAAMTASGGTYTGTIPGQSAGAIVQFYVRATDSLGAVSFFPPEGPASRALIQWADGRALTTLPSGAKPHNLRVIITGADATEMYKYENLMSNADVPCTIVWDESVAYYRAGAQLKGSKHSRWQIVRVGYNLRFPPDDLFLGVHSGVALDRSGDSNGVPGQKEILIKTLMNLAGGIYSPEDDLIRLIPAVATGSGYLYDGSAMLGACILSKTRLKDDFLEGQWEDGEKGMLFKYDAIYSLVKTIDPATRVIDATRAFPENPKIADGYSGAHFVDFVNLGSDKELYRGNWIVENGRADDDYTALINALTAIGQTGGSAAFNTQTAQYVDVNAWLRATIPPALFGIHDNYLGVVNGRHNALIYFPPGGKATLFPWDMDYLNIGAGTTAALTNCGDLPKFLANPVYKRLFWGHMLDILNRSFNTATMTKWATHYSRFSSDDMVPMVSSYLTPRAAYALTQINAAIPSVTFAISSPANSTSVNASSITVTGSGWINVSEIRLVGSPQPLAVTWTGESTWSLTLPLAPGTFAYTLSAYGPDGAIVGTSTRTLTSTSSAVPAVAGMLAVSELNYNPPTADDLSEFIELTNLTTSTLDLSNCHFDEEIAGGIAYTFPFGTQLAPRARVVVVRDRTSYQTTYGNLNNVAPGAWATTSALSNSGETIVLYAANATLIFAFTYNDAWYPTTDGGGRTLAIFNPYAPAILFNSAENWRASAALNGSPGANEPNLAPTVNAGGIISGNVTGVSLNGLVADDSQPDPPRAVTYAWTQQSGPGIATFVNASAAATSATFSLPGSYVLRLSSSDSLLTAFNNLTVFAKDTAAAWLARHPSIGTLDDDFDQDGRSNYSEFALGTDPALNNGGTPPEGVMVNGALTLTYTRIKPPSTVSYVVEVADDVGAFRAANVGELSEQILADDGITQTVKVIDTVTTTGQARRFLRLRTSPVPGF